MSGIFDRTLARYSIQLVLYARLYLTKGRTWPCLTDVLISEHFDGHHVDYGLQELALFTLPFLLCFEPEWPRNCHFPKHQSSLGPRRTQPYKVAATTAGG